MNKYLEDIGFYTLSDKRARSSSSKTPMWRCEMILTDQCNFKCTYCRGLHETICGTATIDTAIQNLNYWIKEGLVNVRFSGGEPLMYKGLGDLVKHCKNNGVKRIAVSTNGSFPLRKYLELVDFGVNDFSISLDACCAAGADEMSGTKGKFETIANNIRALSKLTYVTVGVVLTADNVDEAVDIIEFAHSLGVADIRIISAAQYNQLLPVANKIRQTILDAHPILNYRITNIKTGRNVRGLSEKDCSTCHLIKDDSVIAGSYHFPCVIYMREGGNPIGKVGPSMREDRLNWITQHNSFSDDICRNNCLDVCIDYNNKARHFKNTETESLEKGIKCQ